MNPRPSNPSSTASDSRTSAEVAPQGEPSSCESVESVPEPRTPKGAEVTWSSLVGDAMATGMTMEDAIDHITSMAVTAHRMQAMVDADPIETSGENQNADPNADPNANQMADHDALQQEAA